MLSKDAFHLVRASVPPISRLRAIGQARRRCLCEKWFALLPDLSFEEKDLSRCVTTRGRRH